MCDDCGISGKGLVRLLDIAEGRVESKLIPAPMARAMYETEMMWLRGETPWQKLMLGLSRPE